MRRAKEPSLSCKWSIQILIGERDKNKNEQCSTIITHQSHILVPVSFGRNGNRD
jgi:hypothetical protein